MSLRPSWTRAMQRIGVAPWAIIGILLSGVLGNATHSLFDELIRNVLNVESTVGHRTLALLFALLSGLAILAVIVWLQPAPRLVGPIRPVSGERKAEKKKGLIFLVGVGNSDSGFYAISHHLLGGPLEKVWLVPSHGNEAAYFGPGSAKVAEEIKARAEALAVQQGRRLEIVIHTAGVSPADAQDTYDFVRRLLRHRPLPPEEMIADFTSGTKPMSTGVIMACLGTGCELEYVSFFPPQRTMHGPFLIDYHPEAFDLKREAT